MANDFKSISSLLIEQRAERQSSHSILNKLKTGLNFEHLGIIEESLKKSVTRVLVCSDNGFHDLVNGDRISSRGHRRRNDSIYVVLSSYNHIPTGEGCALLKSERYIQNCAP